ncbi:MULTISPECIES: hypothetical protein [Ehrlichia]|uniref:Uncharacterized protein n=1 Tax=Ehrlichia cf. muris str. EmCRT TaxID=1359167 RepID=A0A0F3NGS3_9RICK|nr:MULTISPECIES: hypothetical protein [Ehrlichia]KJV66069.1 hypothetical protein EMUCRT_0261 [Ehrlichia cf. muris str. EmCRT]
MLLMLLVAHLARIFFGKDTTVGNLVTGFLALFLVTVIITFGFKYLSDNLQPRIKSSGNLFRKEHEEKVELPQVELNKDFEQSIKRLLELKKSALEDLSTDYTVETQQSQLILEKYDSEIKHLENMQERQVEILQQSDSLTRKFQMQNWKHGKHIKYAQDIFIKHIKDERYSHYCFCSYLDDFKVGHKFKSDRLKPTLSAAMIYVNCVPSITYIFKLASAFLNTIGSLQIDHQVPFVQYCQRVYDFDCKVALKTEISLFNELKSDLHTYVNINYWINNSYLNNKWRTKLISSIERAEHSLKYFSDEEYLDMVTSCTKTGMESTINELKNSVNVQIPEHEINRMMVSYNPVIEELVRELDVLETVRVTNIDNMQPELPQASLSGKIIGLIRSKEELKNLMQEKQELSLENGTQAKINQMMSYIKSQFSKVKDRIVVNFSGPYHEVMQVQALLGLESSPFSLEFNKRSLNPKNVKMQISCLYKQLFDEEKDQIGLLQCIQNTVAEAISSIEPSMENLILKLLYDNLICYNNLLKNMQITFSEQNRIMKDNNIVFTDLLRAGLSDLEGMYNILYARYEFLDQNYNKVTQILLKLVDIRTISSCWSTKCKNMKRIHNIFKEVLTSESQYNDINLLLNKLQELKDAAFVIKDGSSYLHLLDIPENEKNDFLAELSRQEDQVKLLGLLSAKKIDFDILNNRIKDQYDRKVQSLKESLAAFKYERDKILMHPNIVRYLSKEMIINLIDGLERLKEVLILLFNQDDPLIFNGYIEKINSVINLIKGVPKLLYGDNEAPEQKPRNLISCLEYLQKGFSIDNQLSNLLNLKTKIQEEERLRLPILEKLKTVFLESEEAIPALLELKNKINQIIDQINQEKLLIAKEHANEMEEFIGLLSDLLDEISNKEDISEFLYSMEKFDDSLSKLGNHAGFLDDKKDYVECILNYLKDISELSNELRAGQIKTLKLDNTESLGLIKRLMNIEKQLSIKEQLSVCDDLCSFVDVVKYLQKELVELHQKTVDVILETVGAKECNKNSLIKLVNEKLESLDNNSDLLEIINGFICEEYQDLDKLIALQDCVLKLRKEPNDIKKIIDQLLKLLPNVLSHTEIKLCENLKEWNLNEDLDYLKKYIDKTRDEKFNRHKNQLNEFLGPVIDDICSMLLFFRSNKGYGVEVTLCSKMESSLKDLQNMLQQDNRIIISNAEKKFQEIYKGLQNIFLTDDELPDILSSIESQSEVYKEKLALNSYTAHFLSFIKFLSYTIIKGKFDVERNIIGNLNDKIHQQEILISELRTAVIKELDRSVQVLLDQSVYYPQDLINVRLIKKKLMNNEIICDDLMEILEDDVRAKVACSTNVMLALIYKENINHFRNKIDTYKKEQMSHACRLKLYTVIKKFMDNSVDEVNVQYLRKIDDNIQQPPAALFSSEDTFQHGMAIVTK